MFLPLCLLLVLGLMRPVSSIPYEIITAQPGDDVTLVCDVPIVNATVALVVIKHERDGGYDFICNKPYAEKGFNDDCMRLYNLQMEGGYVHVRIKNVSIRSTGIYECRFFIDEMVTDSDGNNTLDTLSNYIVLVVPDQAAGGEDGRGDFSNKDGGNKDKGKDEDFSNKDGGNKDKGSVNGKHEDLSNEDGGNVSGLLDLIGLVLRIVPFVVVVTVAVAVFMIFRKRKRQAALNVGQPPADGVNETLV